MSDLHNWLMSPSLSLREVPPEGWLSKFKLEDHRDDADYFT